MTIDEDKMVNSNTRKKQRAAVDWDETAKRDNNNSEKAASEISQRCSIIINYM